jgi:hypothetical protein
MGPRLIREKALSVLFEDTKSLKNQLKPAKAKNPKKRKVESLLLTEINLTNSSAEMEGRSIFYIPLLSVDLI